MDLGLTSKIALVTGSTAGIGFTAAEALAREGARVIVNGRTGARVEAAVARLRRSLPRADVQGIAADVATAAGCDSVTRAFPDVDVLVNNMGIFEPKPFDEITDADWLRFFEANVLSGVRLARHYARAMRSRNWGRIVFVSSESGLQIPTEMIHYGVTKTAQIAVARGLAETLDRHQRHRQQCSSRAHRLRGSGQIRGADGAAIGQGCGSGRARILPDGAPLFHPAALHHHRGGRRDDRLRLQRAGIGDDGRSLARRRRGRPRNRVSHGQAAAMTWATCSAKALTFADWRRSRGLTS